MNNVQNTSYFFNQITIIIFSGQSNTNFGNEEVTFDQSQKTGLIKEETQ